MERTTSDAHVLDIELEVEKLEGVIAPGGMVNHNETLVHDTEEVRLDVEELEEVIAPRGRVDQPDPPNHWNRRAARKRHLVQTQFNLNSRGEATFTREHSCN